VAAAPNFALLQRHTTMLTRRRVTSHHPLWVINRRIANLATTALRSNNVGAIDLGAGHATCRNHVEDGASPPSTA
jgi:hypothetical protein